ncbi:PREDICTED: salivary glue protein Sgs-3-like [Cyprinodon variegatus]|uniref:salivary glue protein Sgs-3-like n=1 Tax=Cyprinodon variegatus TaxID=28743 RepID=UPI000742A81B|nr:PREDICTED: salivary glue protein Sgs-3-like [Cyprinodon variegatus]
MELYMFLLLLAGLIGTGTAQASTTTTGSTSGGTTAMQTSTQPETTVVGTGSTSGGTTAMQTSTQPGTTASTTTTTTAAPTTTTTRRPPPPPEPKIELTFSVQENFTEDLKNENSPRFIELKGEVTKGIAGDPSQNV